MLTGSKPLFTTSTTALSANGAARANKLVQPNDRRWNSFLLCLASGLLYGFSWPILPEVNLSFFAWFAFVPLFIFLERHRHSFWKSLGGSYAAMLIFCLMTASWGFNFPQSKALIALIVLLEVFYFTFPVIPFFFLQKRLGFSRALWLFPLLWTVWEWLYLGLEFTMGTHLSAYSQSSNIWLIQFIDLTGMWGLSCWLLFFNVFVYRAYRLAGDQVLSGTFLRKLALPALLMLGLPLAYSISAFHQFGENTKKSLTVTVIPTYFTADFFANNGNLTAQVEATLYITDSVHYAQRKTNTVPDLYLWPETGTSLTLGEAQLGKVLREAVIDYDAALLTGGAELVDTSRRDFRRYVTGTLLSAQTEAVYHHRKTKLTPGQESIPYHRWLAQLPGFPIEQNDPRFKKVGQQTQPLPLTTWDDDEFSLGVSLCFEQWHPTHFTRLARNGAELFLHLAGENWYGEIGFRQFMANVTRLRCIENRRAAARSSNVGISGFIDALGRMNKVSTGQNAAPVTATINASNYISPYTRFPYWFPFTCLGFILLGFGKLY